MTSARGWHAFMLQRRYLAHVGLDTACAIGAKFLLRHEGSGLRGPFVEDTAGMVREIGAVEETSYSQVCTVVTCNNKK